MDVNKNAKTLDGHLNYLPAFHHNGNSQWVQNFLNSIRYLFG
jgi:hypothetical protein